MRRLCAGFHPDKLVLPVLRRFLPRFDPLREPVYNILDLVYGTAAYCRLSEAQAAIQPATFCAFRMLVFLSTHLSQKHLGCWVRDTGEWRRGVKAKRGRKRSGDENETG